MKKKKEKAKKFINEKRTIKKLAALVALLVVMLAHLLVFHALSGQALTFSNASTAIGLTQSIVPIDPVGQADVVEKSDGGKQEDLSASKYRVLKDVNPTQS